MKEYIIRSKAVFTGNSEKPQPAAILVSGYVIKKMLPWDFDKQKFCMYQLYDYGEHLIMPSFLDAHTHIFSGAVASSDYVCDLSKCTSKEECVELIKEFRNKNPDYKRLRGNGWFIGNWNDASLPDKRSLDYDFPDIPVYLQCADAHSMWLNQAAINEAGIVPRPELENGVVCTFENGEPSGLLLEPEACKPAMDKYMEFSEEEMISIHQNFQHILALNGVAAVSEMFADDYNESTYKNYDILQKLDEEGLLSAHIFFYTKLFGYTDFTEFYKMQKRYNKEEGHLHVAGVKGFIDGVTETYTGLLLEPYEDKPDTCGEGLPLWPEDKMQQEIIAANREGIQVRLHCIADGSVRMALNMYENALEQCSDKDIRNTIEHIENIHPKDIPRFGKLGVIPSMQPYHVTLSNGEKILRIGKERCSYEWAAKSILEENGHLAIGTDYPVVDINPFKTIYAALTRRNEEGELMCRNPREVLELSEVLKGYTKEAAYVYHQEERMGTLEEGKLANIIVLSRNLFESEPQEILKTKVLVNYFEGNIVYQKEKYKEESVWNYKKCLSTANG